MATLRRWAQELYALVGKRTMVWLGLATFGSFLLTGVEFAFALGIQLFLKTLGLVGDDIQLYGNVDAWGFNVTTAVVFLLCIGIFRFLAQLAINLSAGQAAELFRARCKVSMIHFMLKGSKKEYQSSGWVNHIFSDVIPRTASALFVGTTILSSAIQAIGLTILMVNAAWRESLLAIGVLAIIALVLKAFTRKAIATSKDFPEQQELLFRDIQRYIRSWLFVRIMRIEDREFHRMNHNILKYSAAYCRYGVYKSINYSLASFSAIILIVVIFYPSQAIWNTPGTNFLAFLYLLMRMVTSVSAGVSAIDTFSAERVFLKKFLDIFRSIPRQEWQSGVTVSDQLPLLPSGHLDYKGEAFFPKLVSRNNQELPALNPPAIKIENLSYRYPGTNNWVLDKINLTVPAGAQVGITGESGCGKSTLLHLILGLLEPERGQINIAGQSPSAFFGANSDRIGYVGPDPFIVEGSILDNLLYSVKRDISEAEAWEALESARIADVVRKLDAGWHYNLKENGDGLSAGQKQRIAIARAILAQPTILILDEATSNLDDRNEAEIAEVLRLMEETTVVIVSHREGILRYCHNRLTLGPSKHEDGIGMAAPFESGSQSQPLDAPT